MIRIVLSLVLLAAPLAALAQAFPSKPIRMVLPSAPGAGGDILARIIGEPLSKGLGQPVVIDNRPGASGNIAAEIVVKAAPDGYTLMQGNSSTHSVNPYLFAKASYDPVRDFTPVTRIGSVPNILIVNPALGVKSVPELIALAKKEPGRLTFGSGGLGTTHHLAGQLFAAMAEVDIVHVPYKGAAQAVAAVLSGEVSMMFPNIPNALAFIRQGRLLGLAVTTPERISWLPGVPTVAESGLPGYEVIAWVGVFAPAGTPAPVVERLNAELIRVHNLPEIREKLGSQGYEINLMSGDAFRAFIRSESEKWGRIVRTSGVKVE